MSARTRRIIGWASVAALYSALILAVIVFAAVVFHRLSVERFGLGYYRVWVKPWTSWHHVELVLSTSHGVRFIITGPPDDAAPPE